MALEGRDVLINGLIAWLVEKLVSDLGLQTQSFSSLNCNSWLLLFENLVRLLWPPESSIILSTKPSLYVCCPRFNKIQALKQVDEKILPLSSCNFHLRSQLHFYLRSQLRSHSGEHYLNTHCMPCEILLVLFSRWQTLAQWGEVLIQGHKAELRQSQIMTSVWGSFPYGRLK